MAGVLVVLAAAASAGAERSAGQVPTLQPVIGNDSPAWSPDGARIAFTSFRHGLGDIYTAGPDGRGERRITRHPAHDDHPTWSPDGSRIAFSSTRNGNPEIYAVEADGTNEVRLTSHPARDYYPAWSPDGSRIAFQSDRGGLPAVYVMRADGTDARRVSSGRSSDYRPTWTPDGRIAFVSSRTGTMTIFVVNADGTGERKLSAAPSHHAELEPHWSPDGTRVVFVAQRDPPIGNSEIYVMDADGTNPVRLTNHPRRDTGPTWSPDGSRIAFARGPSAFRPEVHVMNADGTGVRRITTTAVRYVVVDERRAPARPTAGRRFSVAVLVSEPTGDPLARAAVSCTATIAGKRVAVAARRFARSVATCAWNVPGNTKGQRLRLTIGVAHERSSVQRRLNLLVG